MRYFNHQLLALRVYHTSPHNEWQISVPVRDTANPFIHDPHFGIIVRHLSDQYTYITPRYIYITTTPGSDNSRYGSDILPPRIAELITEAIDEANK